MDKKDINILEKQEDELTMSCIYIRNCNNQKMLETLLTQFGFGNDDFPWELERCCSICSTAFKNGKKQPTKGKNDDDVNNSEDGKDGFVSAHSTMNNAEEILAVHASNKRMWENIDNNNNGLLVGKEDLVC